MTAQELTGRGEARVIGLVSLAHSASHFYQLALPPLFPLLKETFAVSYTELGTLMTVFYATSGAAQTAAGFLVDRFSARAVLLVGLALFCGAIILAGLAPEFWVLFPLAILAGLGNSAFHPADLSILTARVRRAWHGRAYGIHTLGGNLGYALAPIVMLGLAVEFGWRNALIIAGAAGLVLLATLFLDRRLLEDQSDQPAPQPQGPPSHQGRPILSMWHGFRPLLTAPVLLCFSFFILLSASTIGLQSFFPALMSQLYDLPIVEGAPLLSVFLFGSSGGVLLGGFLAERVSARHHVVIALGLTGASALFVAIGFQLFPSAALFVPFALAGILVGLTMPSRDMLVRETATANARGRVFGFVYSGLDSGAAFGPLIVGLLLDYGAPQAVFWLIAVLLLLAIITAVTARNRAPSTGRQTVP
jgi:MFS family permease